MNSNLTINNLNFMNQITVENLDMLKQGVTAIV